MNFFLCDFFFLCFLPCLPISEPTVEDEFEGFMPTVDFVTLSFLSGENLGELRTPCCIIAAASFCSSVYFLVAYGDNFSLSTDADGGPTGVVESIFLTKKRPGPRKWPIPSCSPRRKKSVRSSLQEATNAALMVALGVLVVRLFAKRRRRGR